MIKSTFQGLSLIRKQNQLKILSLLKNGSCSCAQIAEALSLSNVAVYKIMDDLAKRNITKSVTDNKYNVGRKPSIYMLNEEFGSFASVDFSPSAITITVFNVFGNIFSQRKLEEKDYLDSEDVYKAADVLEEMLAEKDVSRLPLRALCVCTPGRTDKETGYFIAAAKFRNDRTINLYSTFHGRFGCPTIVKNDMFFEMTGHKSVPPLASAKSALYLHVGHALGAALYINNDIYEGEHGCAGEFGSTISTNNAPINPEISLGFMVVRYNKDSGMPAIDEKQFCKLFKSGDPLSEKIAKQVSIELSHAISNIIVMLDTSTVILNGSTIMLGEKFIGYINEYISQIYFSSPKCYISPLGDQASLKGCVEVAIDTGIDAVLDN